MKRSRKSFSVSLFVLSVLLAGLVSVHADSGAAPIAVAAVSGQGTIRGDHCNVRSRPSTTAEVVAQLSKGDLVTVLGSKSVAEAGKSRDWLQVLLPDNAKCYVAAHLVKEGLTISDAVNVRCGPGANYHDVGKLAKGEKLAVVKTQGTWLQIKPTPQCTGWVAAELVEVAAAPPPPVASATPAPPPVAPVATPAPAALEIKAVNTDADLMVEYVIKVGVLQASTEAGTPPGTYELLTTENNRLQHRICFVDSPDKSLSRYEGKLVRIYGLQHWRKTERYPIVTVDHLLPLW